MACQICVLRSDPLATTLEAFLDELRSCEDCPQRSGPAADATTVALVQRLLDAGRELRKTTQRLRRSEADRRDLEASVQLAEERVSTLTHVQKASSRESDELLQKRELDLAEKQAALQLMSAPVIHVWDGVLVLPIIGQLDAPRAELLTLRLLEEIRATRCRSAILDLTGVPVADEATARHLTRVVSAARLLGSQVLLCGLHPRVAGELGSQLQQAEVQVTVTRQLADALRTCGVGQRKPGT